MGRRAGYMYGAKLERGPRGQMGAGLGQTTSLGTITLIPPNLDVVETGQEEVVDGVRMRFQLTPGTEAPAEMNIHFPDARVLCIADNAARSMHNILTPRGALVRDARVWAHLWEHPPVERARRYVEAIGGAPRPPSQGPARASRPATITGSPRSSTTSSSPSRRTARHASCRPRRWNSSDSGQKTQPGATSS